MICFRAWFQNDMFIMFDSNSADGTNILSVVSELDVCTFYKQSALFQVGTPKLFFI